MADATNMGIPMAGGQLSGEVSRNAAIKRLQKMGNRQSSGPNTGATGLPKPGGSGLLQKPGLENYSPHPPKPKRI